MVTYEDIKKANSELKATPIKGKDYIEVNERVKAFRMIYPTGCINTEIIGHENGIVIFRAVVGCIDDEGKYRQLATGTAYEKEGSSFINSTSYIENCETSAIGRALGFAGFGIDASIASYEEVANAQANQGTTPTKSSKPATEKQLQMIDRLAPEESPEEDYIFDNYNIKSFEDLTVQEASDIISYLKGGK